MPKRLGTTGIHRSPLPTHIPQCLAEEFAPPHTHTHTPRYWEIRLYPEEWGGMSKGERRSKDSKPLPHSVVLVGPALGNLFPHLAPLCPNEKWGVAWAGQCMLCLLFPAVLNWSTLEVTVPSCAKATSLMFVLSLAALRYWRACSSLSLLLIPVCGAESV